MQEEKEKPIENLAVEVDKEQLEPVECTIHGELPEWLSGSLYRIGAGKYRFGQDRANHMFDGMALINKWTFDKGRVLYKNQFLRSDTLRRNMAAQRIVISEFGTHGYPDPCRSVFSRYIMYFFEGLSDNTSVNLMQLGDQLYCMTETRYMTKIDPDRLDRLDKIDLSNIVSVLGASAHPHLDRDGTTYNVGGSFGRNSCYRVITIPPAQRGDQHPEQKMSVLASIPTRFPGEVSYYHSFGITDNYVVFVEQPYRMNALSILLNMSTKRKTFKDIIQWHGDDHAIFHLVSKRSGDIVSSSYLAPAFFTFHHLNAYEEGGHVVLDLCGYDDASVVDHLSLDYMEGAQGPCAVSNIRRFVLPVQIEKVPSENQVTLDITTASAVWKEEEEIMLCTPEIFEDATVDLPRYNYNYNTRRYRYVYGVDVTCFTRALKYDLLTRSCLYFGERHDAHHLVSEPVFVARPGGQEEGDGVVLVVFVSKTGDAPSYMSILDPGSFTELARAEVPQNVRLNFTFHGLFSDTL